MNIKMSMMDKDNGIIALSFAMENGIVCITLSKEDVKRIEELFSLAKVKKQKMPETKRTRIRELIKNRKQWWWDEVIKDWPFRR